MSHRSGAWFCSNLLVLALLTPASAQVLLSPKPQEGKVTATSTLKADQVLTIGGTEVATSVDVKVRSSSTGMKPEPDGTQRVASTTEAIAVRLSLPGGANVEFDTEKPPQNAPIPQLQPLFDGWRALKGTSYTTVYRDGKVAGVEGAEKILEVLPPQSVEHFRGDLSPDRLRQDAAQAIAVLPEGPVKKGDTWTRREAMGIGAGQTLTFEVQYEYLGTEEREGRSLDKIGILYTGVKLETAPNRLGPQVVQSELQIQSSFGQYLFDRDRGMVVERRMNTRLAGPVTLEVNGMQLAAKLDLTLDTGTLMK